MKRVPMILVAVVLAAAVMACDPPPEVPRDAQVTRDTVDGVIHVVSGDRGAWIRGGSWNVEQTGLLIGEADGPDEYTFGSIGGVAMGDDGRIYVGDAMASELRVFEADGSFRSRIGRAGAGPGEFRDISGVARAPDGIAVLDGRLGRVTVFGLDGSTTRTFRLQRPYMILARGASARFDDRGRFYDPVQSGLADGGEGIAITVHGPRGQVLDTVYVATVAGDRLTVERDGVRVMTFPKPFDPTPSVAVAPDGRLYFAAGDEYRITVLSPSGDTLHVLRRRVRPPPVSEQERDSALAVVAERYRQAGATPPSRVDLPDTKPAVAGLMVDETNHLWVARPGDPSWRHMEWGVHHPDGHYLGAVATPRMRVMHIGRELLAGVVVDDAGVERVGIFRIQR